MGAGVRQVLIRLFGRFPLLTIDTLHYTFEDGSEEPVWIDNTGGQFELATEDLSPEDDYYEDDSFGFRRS